MSLNVSEKQVLRSIAYKCSEDEKELLISLLNAAVREHYSQTTEDSNLRRFQAAKDVLE
jgi:hypothetical protein